jgi:hypothetical protein
MLPSRRRCKKTTKEEEEEAAQLRIVGRERSSKERVKC